MSNETGQQPDPGYGVFHEGELEAHRRYGDPRLTRGLANNVRRVLTPALIRFLESQPFFFLATASAQGDCDCSFRGRQHNRPHDPEPLLIVPEERTILFPDYPGNNFFNSIGNILTNPKAGLLFIDFQNAIRVRINGRATVIDELGDYAEQWPTAARMLRLDVEQIYPNCGARIPSMTLD